MNTDEKPSTPSAQDFRSWEIEILVSGGAAFSLYQLAAVLIHRLGAVSSADGAYAVPLLIAFGMRVLAIYFILHLCVRAFWLSFVLLQKVYPRGVNREKLKWAEPFASKSLFDLDGKIGQLDKLSSLVFAWSVTFVVMFIGLAVANGVMSLVSRGMDVEGGLKDSRVWDFVETLLTITLVLFLIDTFFYGVFRRLKWLARYYYPVYWVWNIITLGFLWRPGIQVIFSNVKNRWKAAGLVFVVTIVVMFLSGNEQSFVEMLDPKKHTVAKTVVNEVRYQDRQLPGDRPGSCIQSDVITEGYLRIYVNYNPDDDAAVDSLKMDDKHFTGLVTLKINDSLCAAPKWIGIHKSSGQKGIQAVLDISNLKNDLHVLRIERVGNKRDTVVIPFWKRG